MGIEIPGWDRDCRMESECRGRHRRPGMGSELRDEHRDPGTRIRIPGGASVSRSGWEGSSGSCSRRVTAQGCSQMGLECLGRGTLCTLSYLCSSVWSLHGKEVLPRVQAELGVHQFLPISSCLSGWHQWEEPGCIFLASLFKYLHTLMSLLEAEQPQLPQLLPRNTGSFPLKMQSLGCRVGRSRDPYPELLGYPADAPDPSESPQASQVLPFSNSLPR